MIHVDPLLLWMIAGELDCSSAVIATKLSEYSRECVKYPPNIKRMMGGIPIDFNCWVLRGFYPNTNIMFKMTVSEFSTTIDGISYIAKVSLPLPKNVSKMRRFDQKDIDLAIGHILLDENNDKGVYTPKCMTPKGMKPLKRSKNAR